MCNDLDLFGDVVVTYQDVELYVRAIPRYVDGLRFNALESYVETYNVVNKIKRLKLAESFYCLNDNLVIDKFYLSRMTPLLFKPVFKPLPIIPYSMLKSPHRPLESQP